MYFFKGKQPQPASYGLPLQRNQANLLFQVIAKRCEHGSIILPLGGIAACPSPERSIPLNYE